MQVRFPLMIVTVGFATALVTTACTANGAASPATISAPGPTVTVTETVTESPAPILMAPEQVAAITAACKALDDLPSYNRLLEIEPRPDVASAEESALIDTRIGDRLFEAVQALDDVGATRFVVGRWIRSNLLDVGSATYDLASRADTWVQSPTEEHFTYWVAAFYHLARLAESPRPGCTAFEETTPQP